MFDRVGNLAERVATNVSRRSFLGRLGQGAFGLAAVIGGVLAFPASGRANPTKYCCTGEIAPFNPCKYGVSGSKLCPNGYPPYPCDSSSLVFCPR